MKYIFFFLVITLSMVACSVEQDYLSDDFIPGEGEEVWGYYETQCADPWYKATDEYRDNENVKISSLIEFLTKENVVVIRAKYTFDPSNAIACTACNCQTGGEFMILVRTDNSYSGKLSSLGFNRY